jgi:hypothetical protein
MIKNAKIEAIEDDTNVSGVVQTLLKEWLAGRKTGNRCRSKRKLFCCSPKAYISGQTKQAASRHLGLDRLAQAARMVSSWSRTNWKKLRPTTSSRPGRMVGSDIGRL